MFFFLTAITIFAPALAANKLKIPTPHPISKTTLSLKRCRLLMMAFRKVFVRISSFNNSLRKSFFLKSNENIFLFRCFSLHERQNVLMNRDNILSMSSLQEPFYPNQWNRSTRWREKKKWCDDHSSKFSYSWLNIHHRVSGFETSDFLCGLRIRWLFRRFIHSKIENFRLDWTKTKSNSNKGRKIFRYFLRSNKNDLYFLIDFRSVSIRN